MGRREWVRAGQPHRSIRRHALLLLGTLVLGLEVRLVHPQLAPSAGEAVGLAACWPPMAQVELTRHLTTLFPQLPAASLSLEAATLAEVIEGLERIAPGIAFYICDERGRLRKHVNIFVDNEMLVDRRSLSDRLTPGSRVFIAQALSGG